MSDEDDRYDRARHLLGLGVSPGQVAMQTGLQLAAVDRLAGLPTTAERLAGAASPAPDGPHGTGWTVPYRERPEPAVRCAWGLGCTGHVTDGGMCEAHKGARPVERVRPSRAKPALGTDGYTSRSRPKRRAA